MDSDDHVHIVMLPFMAHGHLIPFLSLARQIHHRTKLNITIANTALNIRHLRTTLHRHPTSGIRLSELPFNSSDHGLPPNIENTENLPFDQMIKFTSASINLQTPFHNLLLDITKKQGKPPLCVISDFFFGWTVDVANKIGTVNIAFLTGSAYGNLAYMSFWMNLPHRKTDSEEFSLPGFPESCKFHVSQLHKYMRMADGNDQWSRILQPQLSAYLRSFGWLVNTVENIEPLGLESLRKYVNNPVWAIGPLLPESFLNRLPSSFITNDTAKRHTGKELGISPEECLQWLDFHSLESVLYISFGSQSTISPSQMMELAIGLEESGNPFIWVIRPPFGFHLKAEFRSEWLPEGFEDRTSKSKQGLLVKNWAPQLEILSHKSTGAFLSHCGWNSTLESLSQGVKMIAWPIAAEQAFNSKMLVEEMGVCVELTRGMNSTISGEEVKKVIEMVIDKKGKGGDMKNKAEEIAKHIRAAVRGGNEKGSSVKSLDDFASFIRSRN